MGIVASIVATPIAQAVAEDEARRELERLRAEEERVQRQRQAEMYRLGDSELEVIKRLSTEINVTDQHSPERSKFREGLTKVQDVEKIYLTGTYKVKYKMLTENLAANSSFRLFPPPDVDGVVRKTRSAYPSVRLRPNTSTYRVYSQHNNHHITFNGTPRHSHYIETPRHSNYNQLTSSKEIPKQNGHASQHQTPKHQTSNGNVNNHQQTPKRSNNQGNSNTAVANNLNNVQTPKHNIFRDFFNPTPKHVPNSNKVVNISNGNGTAAKQSNLINFEPTPKHINKSLMNFSGKQNTFNSTLKSIKQH